MNHTPAHIACSILKTCCRRFSAKHFRINGKQSMSSVEIKIPVPWGHLAGKAWGDPTGTRILGLHGHQDNAGTFDRLVPHLSKSFYFMAIEMPGHGRSSHLPPGVTYNFVDMLIVVNRAVKHLEWSKFSIIGHSMGGGIGSLYASVYPDDIENLVLLDILKPRTSSSALSASGLRNSLSQFITSLEVVKKFPERECSYDRALGVLKFVLNDRLTDEAARTLLARGIEKVGPDSYKFTRDIRLRGPGLIKFRHDEMLELLKEIKCRLMYLRGKDSTPLPPEELPDETIEVYRSKCKEFQYHIVEGNHFFHLNNPEESAALINSFFSCET